MAQLNKPSSIIWHHSAVSGNKPQAKAINAYHKKEGFTQSALGYYGGYHILIEKDGSIFRYRNDNEIGCHAFNHNVNTLGVCLAGNFDVEYPTQEQVASLKKVLINWTTLYHIPSNQIIPHRLTKATDCPGKLLPNDYASGLMLVDNTNSTLDPCKATI